DDGIHEVLFPNEGAGSAELSLKLYDYMNFLYGFKLPVKSELLDWIQVLWIDSKVVNRMSTKDYLLGFARYAKFCDLMLLKDINNDQDKAFKWLSDFYSFIIDELKDTDLFEVIDESSGNGVILSRDLN